MHIVLRSIDKLKGRMFKVWTWNLVNSWG